MGNAKTQKNILHSFVSAVKQYIRPMERKIEPGPGEIWAITGGNSSGHSDMLRRFLGKRSAWVSHKHPFRNLSHTTDLYYQQRFNSCDSEDSLTVREFLMEAAEGHSRGQVGMDHILQVLRLGPMLDEQLIKLSNGETRKVLIAEAWAKQPDLLLLDHPLTGLDAPSRSSLPDILKEIAGQGTTVLMATGPFDIPDGVDRVVVMEDGSVTSIIDRMDFRPEAFDFIQEIPIDKELLVSLLGRAVREKFGTIIRMRDVGVSYEGREILGQINWEVLPGERWALTGPNGAGKSTLISLVMGDNPQAYANDIILFDRKRGTGESIWDIKRNTGFVSPEFYQYFPTDTLCLHVIESGFFDTVGLFRPSRPELESICRRWMELFHIGRHALRPFSLVSPDVQRLCLLARALVKNPALLLLDEPTQGLDDSQQRFFVRLIEAICERSDVAMVYVTHYREHIPGSVTMELSLEGGRIIYSGPGQAGVMHGKSGQ
jgi:molybdate transport system ATP-binding protein